MGSQKIPKITVNEENINLLELCLELRVSSKLLMKSIDSLSYSLKNSKRYLKEFDTVLESLNAGTTRPKF